MNECMNAPASQRTGPFQPSQARDLLKTFSPIALQAFLPPPGTWQQYLRVPESALLPVPDNVSDEAAAQFFVSW